MTYYSREILEQYLKDTRLNKILDIIDETEPYLTEGKTVPANIHARFCRDCPCFQINYWQKDPSVVSGWCKRLSYYETMEDELPFYVYVNSNSFCNEDDIGDEDGQYSYHTYNYVFSNMV